MKNIVGHLKNKDSVTEQDNYRLFYDEEESRLKIIDDGKICNITSGISKLSPVDKLTGHINQEQVFTSTQVIEDALNRGENVDEITIKSPMIQPRLGIMRLWVDNWTSLWNANPQNFYLEFFDAPQEGDIVGRPTDATLHYKWDYNPTETEGELLYPIIGFRYVNGVWSSLVPGEFLQGYVWNSNYNFIPGQLEYNGTTLDLHYIDVTISWCRVITNDNIIQTWFTNDDGYTALNWVTVREGEQPTYNDTQFAREFNNVYQVSQSKVENIVATQEIKIYETGYTNISLGVTGLSLSIGKNVDGYSISFLLDEGADRPFAVCKLITSDSCKIFSPFNDRDNDIHFSGNAKLEINTNYYSTYKVEVFINDNGASFLLLRHLLF
ncbi:MAG: hypothetical protein HUJ68_07520 [Clostridia bacterium]|nr:hypothetical protein [Clostridia bacterium]